MSDRGNRRRGKRGRGKKSTAAEPQKLAPGLWSAPMGDRCEYCKRAKPAEFTPEGPFWVFIKEAKGGFLLCPPCYEELKP